MFRIAAAHTLGAVGSDGLSWLGGGCVERKRTQTDIVGDCVWVIERKRERERIGREENTEKTDKDRNENSGFGEREGKL